MIDPAQSTDRGIGHGRALVRAIGALGIVEPAGPLEHTITGLLLAASKRARWGWQGGGVGE